MQPTKNQKIEALERILKVVFGEPDGEISYHHFHTPLHPRIDIECNIDNVVEIKPHLEMSDIEVGFYVQGFMGKTWNPRTGKRVKGPESRVMVELYLNPQYWKENEKLKKEIKELKKNQKKVNQNG